MPKRAPLRVSKETHLKIIILLVLLVVVLLWLSHCFGMGAAVQQVSKQKKESIEGRPSPKRAGEGGSSVAVQTGTANKTCAKELSNSRMSAVQLELPFYSDTTFVLTHPKARYTLCYDTAYRQAAWVAYLLTRAEVKYKGTERKNVFRCDPEVVHRGWPTATDRDYSRSGFDRGHLLPSADRDDTPGENSATFYLSNVSPQRPALNRQTWRLLEEQVRRWAAAYDSLYVVTGPVLKPGLPRIKGGVGIPERYFKALLVWRDGECRTIAFLIPNTAEVQGPFANYSLSVDDLEAVLHRDLFCHLPDTVEERAERSVDREFWR